jgi:PPK2 family polyphosphate:nucleotide phosphotransferase
MPAKQPQLLTLCTIANGAHFHLKDFDPADTLAPEFARLRGKSLKKRAVQLLADSRQALAQAQELLWASDACSVLVVLQGMDAAGKDGIVKHVMAGMNPAGCEVHAFKQPSAEELKHGFLWRYWQQVPARGRIGIFNRSHYEDVLVVRVHPELLVPQHVSRAAEGADFWANRFDDINRFERHLTRNGTVVIKFFLNLSKGEQKRRLLERLDEPGKQWKFSAGDLHERTHWKQYQAAYQSMLRATSTDWAPWHVIPADHKYIARALVASILTSRIGALGLEYPTLSRDDKRRLAIARRRLLDR